MTADGADYGQAQDDPGSSLDGGEFFCIFCEVIAGRSPGNIRYRDDEVIVFDNRLDWVPLMLLVVPVAHRTQAEMWTDPELMGRIAALAVRFGNELAPGGFRLLSNFGEDALQTQEHAHLHVTGGDRLGLYVRPRPATMSAGEGRQDLASEQPNRSLDR